MYVGFREKASNNSKLSCSLPFLTLLSFLLHVINMILLLHSAQYYRRYPLTMAKGKGCRLTTNDGKEFLDFVSGIATCALGHANKDLIEAVNKQMQQVHHVSNLYYVPAQATLATWLCENSVADKAFFCNSGAEANEAAIKLARRNASNNGITVSIL